MKVYNGVNSKNIDALSKLLNSNNTVLLSSIPEIESSLIADVDSFIYSVRRNESKDAQNIMYKHGITLTNSMIGKVRDFVLKVKKRSDHIKAVGYIFKLGDRVRDDIVIKYSDTTDSDALLLIACILDSIYNKVTVYSSTDLRVTNFKNICGVDVGEYDHNSVLEQRFLVNKKTAEKSSKSSSSWIEEQAKKREESIKKSSESWIQSRTASKEKTFADKVKECTLPKLNTIKKVILEFDSFYNGVGGQQLYYIVTVENSNKTVELNKKFLDKLNTLTSVEKLLSESNYVLSDVNQSSDAYRKLSNCAYDLIKYWRKKFMDEIGNENYSKFIYMMAQEYSKFILSIELRKHFVDAIMQMYATKNISVESGLAWHNIFLSAIYRLNEKNMLGVVGPYVVVYGNEELSEDANVFLLTLAMYAREYKALNSVIRFEKVAFIPMSYQEIDDRAISEATAEREKVSTIAHEASKEMDELLFNGETPGLYRDNQFKRNISVVMSTIFEEIESLWDCQNMVRPGFKTEGNIVTVPTIFANIKGVGGRSNDDYVEFINKLLKDSTHTQLIINQHLSSLGNSSANTYSNPFSTYSDPFSANSYDDLSDPHRYSGLYYNGILSYDRVRQRWGDNYKRLSMDKQQLILSKIDEACKNLSKMPGVYAEEIIDRALNMPDILLREITWFDFTKSSPKIVMLFNGDTTIDKKDCISLYLLNLIGFDIAVFTPTNYIGLESWLNGDFYQDYFLGEPRFDIQYSKKTQKKGFMSRLFGV